MVTAVISRAWREQAGHELLGHLGQAVGVVGVVEGVVVALEERHVGVHPRALHAGQRLRHEAGVDALLAGAISLTTRRTVMTVSAIVSASV